MATPELAGELRSAAGYLRRWSLTKDDARRMADTMVEHADYLDAAVWALQSLGAVVFEGDDGEPWLACNEDTDSGFDISESKAESLRRLLELDDA